MDRRAFIAVLLICIVCSISHAGHATMTGTGRHDWDKGALSLIIAKVSSVKPLPANGRGNGGSHIAQLEPIACLAGHFDPSSVRLLEVRFYAGDTMTSIKSAPPAGSLVLAVICPAYFDGDVKRPYMAVTSDICTFMPDRSALVQISDLNDKLVEETIERIRDARIRGRE